MKGFLCWFCLIQELVLGHTLVFNCYLYSWCPVCVTGLSSPTCLFSAAAKQTATQVETSRTGCLMGVMKNRPAVEENVKWWYSSSALCLLILCACVLNWAYNRAFLYHSPSVAPSGAVSHSFYLVGTHPELNTQSHVSLCSFSQAFCTVKISFRLFVGGEALRS